MAYDTLVREAKDLPEEMIEQAIQYIRFLKYTSEKKRADNASNGDRIIQRSVDPLADEFISMADDFDRTPECFEEYM